MRVLAYQEFTDERQDYQLRMLYQQNQGPIKAVMQEWVIHLVGEKVEKSRK